MHHRFRTLLICLLAVLTAWPVSARFECCCVQQQKISAADAAEESTQTHNPSCPVSTKAAGSHRTTSLPPCCAARLKREQPKQIRSAEKSELTWNSVCRCQHQFEQPLQAVASSSNASDPRTESGRPALASVTLPNFAASVSAQASLCCVFSSADTPSPNIERSRLCRWVI